MYADAMANINKTFAEDYSLSANIGGRIPPTTRWVMVVL